MTPTLRTCRGTFLYKFITFFIVLALDRDSSPVLVNEIMTRRVPQSARNFLTSWGPVSFPDRTHLHGIIYLVSFFWE